jgi:hypothetical protein
MATIKATTPQERSAKARLAVRTREHGPDHPATCAARQEFRSERWLAAVRAVVDDAPPLSEAQKARLATLLAPVAAVAADGAA